MAESGFYVADSFPVTSEYKVNPHIRKKQALDMDLVLVCQKKRVSSKAASLPLGQAVQRALDSLPVEASSGNKSKLFLHFVGGLMKAASAAWEVADFTYEWFAEALSRFDDLVANDMVNRVSKEPECPDSVQLSLI